MSTIYTASTGYGFDFYKLEEKSIKKFVKNHNPSITNVIERFLTKKEKESFLQNPLFFINNFDFFEYYCNGFIEFVGEVLSEESGLPLVGTYDTVNNKYVIMLEDKYAWEDPIDRLKNETIESITETLLPYAKEFGEDYLSYVSSICFG